MKERFFNIYSQYGIKKYNFAAQFKINFIYEKFVYFNAGYYRYNSIRIMQ